MKKYQKSKENAKFSKPKNSNKFKKIRIKLNPTKSDKIIHKKLFKKGKKSQNLRILRLSKKNEIYENIYFFTKKNAILLVLLFIRPELSSPTHLRIQEGSPLSFRDKVQSPDGNP